MDFTDATASEVASPWCGIPALDHPEDRLQLADLVVGEHLPPRALPFQDEPAQGQVRQARRQVRVDGRIQQDDRRHDGRGGGRRCRR